jgi:ABC-2 type transport system ATP-binding protein
MNVIDCNDVSIRYITGDFKSIGLKEYVMRKITHNFYVKEFWADRHITFSLQKGDMLGIIGSNGAGKSTLLKAVTGIMTPTGGSIKTHGKIAALLELASGFDAHMTVRENTYLRGAMLGYTKQFLDDKYDEIISFAELEEFQDYMFKQLSSGMKSRLAFSIACLVDPDILILDEVLSVGDGAFRKKSGDKMMEILSGGTTGVLVSHSIGQVRELCNKILWLDHGNQIAFSDDVQLYCDAYEEFLATKELPETKEDIVKLAEGFAKRTQKLLHDKQVKESKRLEKVLEKGTSESAVLAAIKILQKSKPEALAPEYAGKS